MFKKIVSFSFTLAIVFGFSLFFINANLAEAYDEMYLGSLPTCGQARTACTSLAAGQPQIEYQGCRDGGVALMWCNNIPMRVDGGMNYLGNLTQWASTYGLRFLDQTADAGVIANFGGSSSTYISCIYSSTEE